MTCVGLWLALSLAGCTATVRATLACEHCFCSWGTRDVRHPVSCDSIDYDILCCMADSS